MKHRVWLEDDVLWIKLVGFCDHKDLSEVSKMSKQLLEGKNSHVGVIDLSAITSFPDADDREELLNGTRAAGLNKVAVIGSPQVRLVAKTILELLGSHAETEFFQDQEAALTWLL